MIIFPAFCENLGNLTRLERKQGVGRLKVPLKGGVVRRRMEISLSVSFKNIGEAQQTKGSIKQLSEVASHAGLGEKHSKRRAVAKSLEQEEM